MRHNVTGRAALSALALSLAAALCWGPPAIGYNPALSDAELREVTRFGQQAREYADLVRGHTVSLGAEPQRVTVFTPWLSVADAARTAALKYLPFVLADARRIANRDRDSLMLIGYVVYSQRNFWKDLHVVILQDGRAYQPSRVKADVNLDGIDCSQFGCSYPAVWDAVFPRRFSAWKGAVGVVTWYSEERRFDLPLGKMR